MCGGSVWDFERWRPFKQFLDDVLRADRSDVSAALSTEPKRSRAGIARPAAKSHLFSGLGRGATLVRPRIFLRPRDPGGVGVAGCCAYGRLVTAVLLSLLSAFG
jgi:hypothetical protein